MHGFTYRFVIYAMLAVNLIYISNIDIREQAVSHEIIITSYICGLCVLIWNKDLAWWEPLLSGAVYGLVFALISRATHSALGFGDALITGAIGVYLGFFHTLIVVVYAVIFGGLLSLILFILKRVTKQSTLPFAPFLAIGFFASIIS
jgi:prepilin signal peptidase PulO-like enzyme (type II secretory pathway)